MPQAYPGPGLGIAAVVQGSAHEWFPSAPALCLLADCLPPLPPCCTCPTPLPNLLRSVLCPLRCWRQIHWQVEFKRLECPLRFEATRLAAFPDAKGYVVGSIEGRVAVQDLQESPEAKSFTFKCHRDNNDISTPSTPSTSTRYVLTRYVPARNVPTPWLSGRLQ